MGIIFTAAVVACKALSNSLLNMVAKTKIKSRSGHYLFATLASAVALLFVIIYSKGIPEIESVDILHGIILGVLAIGEEFFLLSALECGAMSTTVMCALMAFPLGHIAFGHANVPAIIISLAAIMLVMLDRFNKDFDNEHERHEFVHWRKYAITLIIITALVEIEEKSHTLVATSENHMGYYFVAYLTGVILAGGLFLWRSKGKKEETKFEWDIKFVIVILFCGIMKALIYIVLGLAAAELTEELVVEVNGSIVMVLLLLMDRFVFKTKLKWNHYLATALAIINFLVV